LPSKLGEKKLDSALKSGFFVARDCYCEGWVDQEAAIARLDLGGHGHEIERLLHLCLPTRREYRAQYQCPKDSDGPHYSFSNVVAV
jgi:hypothetical protein